MHHPLAILESQRSVVLYAALPLRHDIYIPATGEKKNQNEKERKDERSQLLLYVICAQKFHLTSSEVCKKVRYAQVKVCGQL
jgi:hypothetical protein